MISIASDVNSFKKELRQVAKCESDEIKSNMKPSSAHKVESILVQNILNLITLLVRSMPGETCLKKGMLNLMITKASRYLIHYL